MTFEENNTLTSLDNARRMLGLSVEIVDALGEEGELPMVWTRSGWQTTPRLLHRAARIESQRLYYLIGRQIAKLEGRQTLKNARRKKARLSRKGKLQAENCKQGVTTMEDAPSIVTNANQLPEKIREHAERIRAATGLDALPALTEAFNAGRLGEYEPEPPTPRQQFRAALALKKSGASLRESHPDLSRQILELARERLTAASRAAQA
jgi:hypothetical protein